MHCPHLAAAALLFSISLVLHAEERVAPDSMTERVRACTLCHGKEGRATADGYFPRIAGKPAGYLYNQLLNFRDGRRNYPAMNRLLEYLSDDYLREIAQHFADIDAPYAKPLAETQTPVALRSAEILTRHGDASRNLPGCVHCHGESLTGVTPNVPGLMGLPPDYLNAQLGAWRSGQRRASDPDCMATIAKSLTPEEIGAITAWIASRPLPASTKPQSILRTRPPLECGSIRSSR